MSTLRDVIENRIHELTQSSGPVIFAFDNPGDAANDIVNLVDDRLGQAYRIGYEAGRLAERAALFVRTATPEGGKG